MIGARNGNRNATYRAYLSNLKTRCTSDVVCTGAAASAAGAVAGAALTTQFGPMPTAAGAAAIGTAGIVTSVAAGVGSVTASAAGRLASNVGANAVRDTSNNIEASLADIARLSGKVSAAAAGALGAAVGGETGAVAAVGAVTAVSMAIDHDLHPDRSNGRNNAAVQWDDMRTPSTPQARAQKLFNECDNSDFFELTEDEGGVKNVYSYHLAEIALGRQPETDEPIEDIIDTIQEKYDLFCKRQKEQEQTATGCTIM